MSKMLKYALEEIRDDYVLDDDELGGDFNQLKEYLEEAEMTAEFESYSKQFDKLVSTASALEQIEEIIAEEPADIGKTNYEAVVEITNNLMVSTGVDSNSSELVSTEGWNYSKEDRANQRQIALESVGKFIAKIWEAIKKFLLGIWNWIKNLFQWQRIKSAYAKRKIERIKKELDRQKAKRASFEVYLRSLNREILSGEIRGVSVKDTKNLINRVKEKAKLVEDTHVLTKGLRKNAKVSDVKYRRVDEIMRDVSSPIGKASMSLVPVGVEGISLEDINNGFVQSIFSFIDSFNKNDLCYNSKHAYYLLSPDVAQEVLRKRTAAEPKAIQNSFALHTEVFESYFKYLDGIYLPAMKKAITLMTASAFDEKAAKTIIDDIYPDEVKLKSIFGNHAIVENSRVSLRNKICGYAEISVGFIPKTEREAFLNIFESQAGIGKYADAVAVRKQSIVETEQPPLIYITGNKSKLDRHWLDNSVGEIFELFNKTTDFSNRYENIVAGLNKAVERAARNGGDDASKFALLGRLIMYSTNVYVNQLLTTFNSIAPKMIESGCDFVDSHLIANDPTSIISVL